MRPINVCLGYRWKGIRANFPIAEGVIFTFFAVDGKLLRNVLTPITDTQNCV